MAVTSRLSRGDLSVSEPLWRARASTVAKIAAPILLIGVLSWPLLFTRAAFNGDGASHVWFLWHQSLAIRANHMFSLFLNYSEGVFYPQYAFYGGTLFALAGTLSLMLGNAPLETFVLMYVIGFAAAYGGWVWIARTVGLGGWLAHVPGLVFITSPYYLTLIYARGDWPEFLGVSAIPLMIAAGLSILRSDNVHILPAVALVGSGAVFFGGHAITMVWGSTFLLLLGLAIVLGVPAARRVMTWRRVIRLAGLLVPSFLLSAWFLLPTLAYGAHTVIANAYGKGSSYWQSVLVEKMFMVSPGNLFTLSRASAIPQSTVFALSLPILVIAWVLLSVVVLSAVRTTGTWMRILLVICCATVLIGVLMTHAGLLLALPHAYVILLQFSYRLESYVLLGVSGAVLAVLVVIERHHARGVASRPTAHSAPRRLPTRPVRAWLWLLAAVLVASIVGAVQQVDASPSIGEGKTSLSSYLASPLDGALKDYLDGALAVVVAHGGSSREVDFPPNEVHDDRASMIVHLAVGQLVDTNISAGPGLVHVTGARIVGADPAGGDVLEIVRDGETSRGTPSGRHAATPTERISLSTADSGPVVLGRVLTFIAVIVLVLELLVCVLRSRRIRGLPTSTS
jgi:hypothetical protein